MAKLLLVVGDKEKIASNVIEHASAASALTAACFALGQQLYERNKKNDGDADAAEPPISINTTIDPPPSSASSASPASPSSKSHQPIIAPDSPVESRFVGSSTLEFVVKLGQPMQCKITHHQDHASEESLYTGIIGRVAPLPGQAAIAGVEVGMHVRRINQLDCEGKDFKWVLSTIKKAKKSSEGLILYLSHEENKMKKTKEKKEEEEELVVQTKHNETKLQRRTRLMEEWKQMQGMEVWKQKSWLERFHLIVNISNEGQSGRMLKASPKAIKKKLKKKIGIEKFATLSPKQRLLKLDLKEKQAKEMVKEISKAHRYPCILELGRERWDKLPEEKQIEVMVAGEEGKKKEEKLKCPHCQVHLHAKFIQKHIDVMHPIGGKNEAEIEEEEAAEALDALQVAQELEHEEQNSSIKMKQSTIAMSAAMYRAQSLRNLATQKQSAMKFRLQKGLVMLFDTYVEAQKELQRLEEEEKRKKQQKEIEERKNKQKERLKVAERKRKGEMVFQIDLRKSLDMGITKFKKNEMDHHSHSHYSAVVTSLRPGGQAEIAGVQVGYHIHYVDGVSCFDMEFGDIFNLIQKAKADLKSTFLELIMAKDEVEIEEAQFFTLKSGDVIFTGDPSGEAEAEEVQPTAEKEREVDDENNKEEEEEKEKKEEEEEGEEEEKEEKKEKEEKEEKKEESTPEQVSKDTLQELGKSAWKELTWKDRYKRLLPLMSEDDCSECLKTFSKEYRRKNMKKMKINKEEWKALSSIEKMAMCKVGNHKGQECCKAISKETKKNAMIALGNEIWSQDQSQNKKRKQNTRNQEEKTTSSTVPTGDAAASVLTRWKIQKHKQMFKRGKNSYTLLANGYWKLVQDVWDEFNIIDPSFIESEDNCQKPTKSEFMDNYTPMERLDFVAYMIKLITEKHEQSKQVKHFLVGISSLSSSPSILRKTLCMTKEERKKKAEQEADEKWVKAHREIKLVDFAKTLRGQDQEEALKAFQTNDQKDDWNFETLPPFPENPDHSHHRSGAFRKPNETTKEMVSGVRLQTMKDSIQKEYEYNRVENGETHLAKQLGGYDGLTLDADDARLQTMRENLENRLVHDTSVHRWKHIWLRAQHGTPHHLRQAMLDDNKGGLLSQSLLNAKAPPSDPTYGQWGCTPLIAALEAEKFENVEKLLSWGANPRICDRSSRDGFYWACKIMKSTSGHDHWAQKLLSKMIDMHSKLISCNIGDGYVNGGTALHTAARFGLEHTCAFLISRGCDGAARYKGGDDNGLSACVIARNNGWKEVAKMLHVFTKDDWRDWSGGLPDEASWLRLAGRSALGRKVRVTADNFQIVEGYIDDFDPMRGMHHVNFSMSNAAGNWEGWFVLDKTNCQLLSDIGSKIPSPPLRNRTEAEMKKKTKRRPAMPTDYGVSWGGFNALEKDKQVVQTYFDEQLESTEKSIHSSSVTNKSSFQRSSVNDAFERQTLSLERSNILNINK